MENSLLKSKIAGLEEQIERDARSRKRKALHNPNKRFQRIVDALAAGEAIPARGVTPEAAVEEVLEDEVDEPDEIEEPPIESPRKVTRAGRSTRQPQ